MKPDGKSDELAERVLSEGIGEVWVILSGIWREPRPRKSAIIFLICIFLAVTCDETVISSRFPSFTYVDKWEFFALLATFITTSLYWWDQIVKHHMIKTNSLRVANLCLILSLIVLGLSAYWLFQEQFILYHQLSVLLIAFLFLITDLFTLQGLKATEKETQNDRRAAMVAIGNIKENGNFIDQKYLRDFVALEHTIDLAYPQSELIHEAKTETYYSLFAADLPMCLAFILIFVFLLVHHSEHHLSTLVNHHLENKTSHGGLLRFMRFVLPRNPSPGALQTMWKTETDFVGGAIAFQFLLSTLVYIVIAAKVLHKVHGNRLVR